MNQQSKLQRIRESVRKSALTYIQLDDSAEDFMIWGSLYNWLRHFDSELVFIVDPRDFRKVSFGPLEIPAHAFYIVSLDSAARIK